MEATPCRLAYRYLGNSGVRVSNICLGTMTFGKRDNGPVQCTEEESHKILDRFAERGGNFIDTADVYQNGESERIVGNWLKKQKRERFIIATKVRAVWEDPDNPNAEGLSRVRIMHAVEGSLKRLQTDYIDLYQIHAWDSGTPIEETVEALNDLVRAGKIRYVGASNLYGWQLQRVVDLTRERGYSHWISLQQQYSLLCRETEFEVVEVCRREGLAMLPWSPLKGGWLSGKIRQESGVDGLSSGSRLAWSSAVSGRANQSHPDFYQFDKPRVWNLLNVIEEVAKAHNKTVAQVALRWLLQKDTVASVVIGAKTIEQLDDNMGASDGWHLTREQMATLDEASAVDIPYPYEMGARINKNRDRSGIRGMGQDESLRY